MLICPKCGSTSDQKQFIEAFCVDCIEFSLKLPKRVKLEQCTRCERFRIRGEWKNAGKKELVGHISSKCRGDYSEMDCELETGDCLFEFVRAGRNFQVKRNIRIDSIKTICPSCSRASGGYYEAIVQLRGSPEKVERKMAILSTELGRKGTFISKAEEMHGGLDIYVGSSRAVLETLQKIGVKASKISRKLAGRKEGKKLYRTTFAVRI